MCKKECTRNITITAIAPNKLDYAYTPFWDVKSQSLYFVDFLGAGGQFFYRYDYAKKRLYSAGFDGVPILPTFFLPLAGCKNEFAVADSFNRWIPIVRWDGVSNKNLTVVRNRTSIEQGPTYALNVLDIAGKNIFFCSTKK